MESSSCSTFNFAWYSIAPTEGKQTQTPGLNSCTSEGHTVPATPVALVVLLLKDMNIIWYGNLVGHQYAKIYAINTNITWTIYKTNGSKDWSKWISQRTSQDGTKNVKTCNFIIWTTRIPLRQVKTGDIILTVITTSIHGDNFRTNILPIGRYSFCQCYVVRIILFIMHVFYLRSQIALTGYCFAIDGHWPRYSFFSRTWLM